VSTVPTRNDPTREGWSIDDALVRLREWGEDRIYMLPSTGEGLIGSDERCQIRLQDKTERVSRKHARIWRERERWMIEDAGSTNGLKLDGAPAGSGAFVIKPGVEIGVGSLTLLAESARLIALRGFLTRVLGWTSEQTVVVDHALRSIRLAAAQRVGLVLSGDAELVAIAYSIHRCALGPDRPFVSCDPRRRTSKESVRAVENHEQGMLALEAARGGSLCVWGSRLPRDFPQVRRRLRDPDTRVQLVYYSNKRESSDGLLSTPIDIPPLTRRAGELTRIIDEYARDAIAELGATRAAFTKPDHEWVMEHAASSLGEIEKATLRLTAIRIHGNIGRAAARLGMAPVSLKRWIGRRELPMTVE
jgi:FHA domain